MAYFLGPGFGASRAPELAKRSEEHGKHRDPNSMKIIACCWVAVKEFNLSSHKSPNHLNYHIYIYILVTQIKFLNSNPGWVLLRSLGPSCYMILGSRSLIVLRAFDEIRGLPYNPAPLEKNIEEKLCQPLSTRLLSRESRGRARTNKPVISCTAALETYMPCTDRDVAGFPYELALTFKDNRTILGMDMRLLISNVTCCSEGPYVLIHVLWAYQNY